MRRAVPSLVWKSLGYLAVAGLVIGAFAIHSPDAFALVPAGRDPAIVGDWYMDRFGGFRRYQFNKDGTGYVFATGREPRRFQWGTDGDRLRMKQQTSYGWSAPTYTVESAPQSGRLKLEPESSGYSLDLQRKPPENAKIQ